MEFLMYKAKLRRKSSFFKKSNTDDSSDQLYSLIKQLDDDKLYANIHHKAIRNLREKTDHVSAFLNAARALSQTSHKVLSPEEHIKAVKWIYTEALLKCDASFFRPICLEMGRFYESHGMFQQAADCFRQSMSISRCVYNLILSSKYKIALDELKNCPSHLMTTKDHTSMFLLELLLNEDAGSTLQHLLARSKISTKRGTFPIDDHMYNLSSLLESLLIFQQERKDTQQTSKEARICEAITVQLSAFLDPAQIQLLNLITAKST